MGDFFDSILDPGGDERDAAAAAAREGALRGGSFAGPGGQSSGFSVRPDGSVSLSSDLGDLGPLRSALLQLVSGRLGASGAGIDPLLSSAAKDATGSLAPIDTGAAGSFGFADSLLKSGVLPELQKQLRGAAGSAFGTARQDIGKIASDRLGILREQARPFEERAFSDLRDFQFATGRSGTTGGGIQTEAFARGLGQADLSRQLAAFDTARGVQEDAARRASTFGSQLTGIRGLEGSLVNSAFSRALSGAGLGSERALGRFNIAGSLVDQRLRNQVAQQGLGLQALGGVQGIEAGGLQNLMAALQAAVARSNTQLGVAGNLTGIAGQAGAAGLGLGDVLGGFLGGILEEGS